MKKYVLLAVAAAALLAGAAGCAAARDVSTPSRALLGHWRNTVPGNGPDVYYAPGERTYAGDDSAAITAGYEVVREDPERFTLEIRSGGGGTSRVSFSEDRNLITVLPAGVPEQLRYEYVDGKQKP